MKPSRRISVGLFASIAMFGAAPGVSFAQAVSADFQLLTSGTAVGTGPSTNWLAFGTDPGASGYNPVGTYSFNFGDPAGNMGPLGFSMAPALTGGLTLQFTPGGVDLWDVSATQLSYAGKAGPTINMNQYLEPTGGTDGTWSSSEAAHWAIQYDLDFYMAIGFNVPVDPLSKDAVFSGVTQTGYLIPYSSLISGMPSLPFTPDGVSISNTNFSDYLLTQIQPELPTNTTYLLVTWMDKTSPDSVKGGLPVTTNSQFGNMTIAYTTDAVPEPSSILLLALGAGLLGVYWIRRKRTHS